MEVIGKIAVKQNKKEKERKNWLTIGLIVFAITMICEMLLGNFAFLALIVPFLYLFNIRNKMGKKVLYKDVSIRVESNDIERKIEISNCEYRDRALYSVRFTILDTETVISYEEQSEKISIKCNAKKVLFLGNTIIPIFENKHYNIQLYVTLEDANIISKTLSCSLHIAR